MKKKSTLNWDIEECFFSSEKDMRRENLKKIVESLIKSELTIEKREKLL